MTQTSFCNSILSISPSRSCISPYLFLTSRTFYLQKDDHLLLYTSILNHPEIQVDYHDYHSSLFATQQQIEYYRTNHDEIEKIFKEEETKYQQNIEAKKEERREIMRQKSPYFDCNTCGVRYEDYFQHCEGEKHKERIGKQFKNGVMDAIENAWKKEVKKEKVETVKLGELRKERMEYERREIRVAKKALRLVGEMLKKLRRD